ncbi:HAD-IIA family hydrolase [Bifidobacterium gallicum]|uniref:HAD family hydrolase n=1 Tax=Bifidobacterium gallicum DSM 20093 = LMG 11596 TaxID=561180 RepID=D1NTW9_9BIFI|nr:HAD-IIA family hydrolase [Bifidobacterium gallicum]EFA23173.1 HAD hydrolase, family IIA [Bifidobacterium gallicum DSM 20093 = LMG 11596]KFI58842.1 HAD family hydrolase [Bifidobacterium gallicum DSM 20093 = LMG 11596]
MLKSTNQPLSTCYRLALLDLDGVVYRGADPIEYAADGIRDAQSRGMTIEYTTNNSSRMQATVAEQLKGFGLDVEPWQVITSSVVAARMVAKHVPAGSRVFVLGAEHLRQEVARMGLEVVDSADAHPVAAIQGWFPDMTWSMMAQISFAVEQGAAYYVTNRDLTIPREAGIAPGCGSMIQAVINATHVEPLGSAGKPESAMYDEARELAAHDGEAMVSVADSLAIGDRLDTDIEAGNRGGYDSLCVLTGVTDHRQLLTAPAYLRPTYVSLDLRGLNEPAPAVQAQPDGSFTCREERAWISDGALHVSSLSSVDALRAACMVAWQAADHGLDVQALTLPDMEFDA